MDRRLLACAAAMAAGVMNMLPWGGPTLRASAALQVSTTNLLAAFVYGLLFVLARWVLTACASRGAWARAARDAESFDFVLHEALSGGVTRSLALDAHGKSLSSAILNLDIPDGRETGEPVSAALISRSENQSWTGSPRNRRGTTRCARAGSPGAL